MIWFGTREANFPVFKVRLVVGAPNKLWLDDAIVQMGSNFKVQDNRDRMSSLSMPS